MKICTFWGLISIVYGRKLDLSAVYLRLVFFFFTALLIVEKWNKSVLSVYQKVFWIFYSPGFPSTIFILTICYDIHQNIPLFPLSPIGPTLPLRPTLATSPLSPSFTRFHPSTFPNLPPHHTPTFPLCRLTALPPFQASQLTTFPPSQLVTLVLRDLTVAIRITRNRISHNLTKAQPSPCNTNLRLQIPHTSNSPTPHIRNTPNVLTPLRQHQGH